MGKGLNGFDPAFRLITPNRQGDIERNGSASQVIKGIITTVQISIFLSLLFKKIGRFHHSEYSWD